MAATGGLIAAGADASTLGRQAKLRPNMDLIDPALQKAVEIALLINSSSENQSLYFLVIKAIASCRGLELSTFPFLSDHEFTDCVAAFGASIRCACTSHCSTWSLCYSQHAE